VSSQGAAPVALSRFAFGLSQSLAEEYVDRPQALALT